LVLSAANLRFRPDYRQRLFGFESERRSLPGCSVDMTASGRTWPDGYRERAAKVRRSAENACSADVRDILLKLASKYDEIAATGRNPRQERDERVLFRRVHCRFRNGVAVLYYLN
jgi:hypothetical protein